LIYQVGFSTCFSRFHSISLAAIYGLLLIGICNLERYFFPQLLCLFEILTGFPITIPVEMAVPLPQQSLGLGVRAYLLAGVPPA
jgi:hypothetical protein